MARSPKDPDDALPPPAGDPPPRVPRTHRQIRSPEERARVYVDWRLSGAVPTARLHACSAQTVRNVVGDVESSPELLALADKMWADLSAKHEERTAEALATTMALILATLRDPKQQHALDELLAASKALHSIGPGTEAKGKAALGLPVYLLSPRTDTPGTPAQALSPPEEPEEVAALENPHDHDEEPEDE